MIYCRFSSLPGEYAEPLVKLHCFPLNNSGATRKPVAGAVGSLIAALDPSLDGQTALYFSEEKEKSPYAIAR